MAHLTATPLPVRPSVADRVEQLVTENLALVGHLVRETLAKVPAHVGRDELTSAAMLALTVSAQHYDDSRGVPFARFAAIRIRGAIMDELRGMDWAARSVRGRAREADAVRAQLCASLGRTPRPSEVAQAMGISPAELDSLDADVARAGVRSLDAVTAEAGTDLLVDGDAGPEAMLLHRERLGYLHDAIAELPDRLRYVVTEYFFHERQMSDIAAELGVTESRISQLRAEATRLLRDGIAGQLDPGTVAAGTGRSASTRAAYLAAIAERSTLSGRLAMSSARGDVVIRLAHERIA